jgi:hypothetical protein
MNLSYKILVPTPKNVAIINQVDAHKEHFSSLKQMFSVVK